MNLPWLYFTVIDSTPSTYTIALLLSAWLYTFLNIIVLPHSTSLYITLPWLYFTLIDSALLYHGSTSLYLILLLLPWIYISIYLTLYYSTMPLLHYTLPWFYFLLDSTAFYHTHRRWMWNGMRLRIVYGDLLKQSLQRQTVAERPKLSCTRDTFQSWDTHALW